MKTWLKGLRIGFIVGLILGIIAIVSMSLNGGMCYSIFPCLILQFIGMLGYFPLGLIIPPSIILNNGISLLIISIIQWSIIGLIIGLIFHLLKFNKK